MTNQNELINETPETSEPSLPKQFQMIRLSMEFDRSIESDFVVNSMEKAIYVINDYLSDFPNEVLIACALDCDKKPIACSIIGMGNEHHISDTKSNLFRFALLTCADSIFVAHNHPRSSVLTLSQSDIQELNMMQQISNMLGIKLRDFIVVGNIKHDRTYYSWYNNSLISHKDFAKSISDIEREGVEPIRSLTGDESLSKKSIHNDLATSYSHKRNQSHKGLFSFFK